MSKNLMLAASFEAAPDRLYDMYLDAAAHAAMTGAPVIVEARAGAAFSAFDGVLSGLILHVVPKRLIVQTWRSKKFPADADDSILVLNFAHEPGGARIELVHLGIPEEDYSGVSQGWGQYYWTPWRAYLKEHPTG